MTTDAAGTSYAVCHLTDFATRYQQAGLLQSKASAGVVAFIRQAWRPLMGPPRPRPGC